MVRTPGVSQIVRAPRQVPRFDGTTSWEQYKQVFDAIVSSNGWRGGGAMSPSSAAGGLLPVDVADAPALSVEGPRSVPSRISVMLVDGTIAGDTPGRECPRDDRDWRPLAGEMKPAGVSVGGGDAGLPHVGETLSSPDVTGRSLPVVPAGWSSSVGAANPAAPDGAGGPVGPWTLSP